MNTRITPFQMTGTDRYVLTIDNVEIIARKVGGHVFVDLVRKGEPIEDAIASVMCTTDGLPPIIRIEEAQKMAAA